MEHLVSSWYNDRSLPESFILPPEDRPGILSLGKNIPVVDLGAHDQPDILQQILEASQEFGMFQVINHGVPSKLIDEAMGVFKEFHALSAEDKAIETSKDPEIHPILAEKPPKYREVVAIYTAELRKVGFRILEFIAQGLGLNPDHFSSELGENQILLVNHYPPCPDPNLTLGFPKHRGPVVINILLQSDVYGLEVFKDEEWIGVEPIPYAFVVTLGSLMQIISNGKLKGKVGVVSKESEEESKESFATTPSSGGGERRPVNMPLVKVVGLELYLLLEYSSRCGDN
nr:protein downy mildew resistance 6 [Quercus suber]